MALVGHWKLDGNALDSSGNGLDGSLVGSPVVKSGIISDCYNFDGSNSIEINHDTGFTANSKFTMCAWYKGTDTGTALLSLNYISDPHTGIDIYTSGGEVGSHIISSWSGDAI